MCVWMLQWHHVCKTGEGLAPTTPGPLLHVFKPQPPNTFSPAFFLRLASSPARTSRRQRDCVKQVTQAEPFKSNIQAVRLQMRGLYPLPGFQITSCQQKQNPYGPSQNPSYRHCACKCGLAAPPLRVVRALRLAACFFFFYYYYYYYYSYCCYCYCYYCLFFFQCFAA